MAGRTHGQHALPVTFGYKAAVWLDEVLRQRERLVDSRPRVLVGEFGGAVGTLASLGRKGLRVQNRLMARLGLGVPAIPAKTAGDRFAEFFLLLAMLSATLGKIAQNIYNLQVTERRRGHRVRGGQGRQLGHAPQAQPRGLGLGGPARAGCCARGPATILDYVHSEWEDDHRQGETAWASRRRSACCMGAQLVTRASGCSPPWWSSPRTCCATSTAAAGWCSRRR